MLLRFAGAKFWQVLRFLGRGETINCDLNDARCTVFKWEKMFWEIVDNLNKNRQEKQSGDVCLKRPVQYK
jgi:hypothetical protein